MQTDKGTFVGIVDADYRDTIYITEGHATENEALAAAHPVARDFNLRDWTILHGMGFRETDITPIP